MCNVVRNALMNEKGRYRHKPESGYTAPGNSDVAHRPKKVVTFREQWSVKMSKGAVFNYVATDYEWS